MKWRVSSCSFHAKRSMFGLLPSECPPSAIMRNLRGRSAGLRCHYCDTSKQVQLEQNSKHTIVPRLQHCVNKIGWLMLVINTELSLELITFELSPSNSSPCVSNESWLMRCHLPTGHSHWTRHCTWQAGEDKLTVGREIAAATQSCRWQMEGTRLFDSGSVHQSFTNRPIWLPTGKPEVRMEARKGEAWTCSKLEVPSRGHNYL
jgi:hypothetical protein